MNHTHDVQPEILYTSLLCGYLWLRVGIEQYDTGHTRLTILSKDHTDG